MLKKYGGKKHPNRLLTLASNIIFSEGTDEVLKARQPQ